jgi:hypothetical protein
VRQKRSKFRPFCTSDCLFGSGFSGLPKKFDEQNARILHPDFFVFRAPHEIPDIVRGAQRQQVQSAFDHQEAHKKITTIFPNNSKIVYTNSGNWV